jgi:hypothetical protein
VASAPDWFRKRDPHEPPDLEVLTLLLRSMRLRSYEYVALQHTIEWLKKNQPHNPTSH